MTENVEYKFQEGDKAIARVRLFDNSGYTYAPVEIIRLEGFEVYSGVAIPKYSVRLIESWTFSLLFETDLYTKEGIMDVFDLFLGKKDS